MSFRFPAGDSSDAPSTPNSHRSSRHNIPSTTPAGPPPTSYTAASFTPKGNPPSSVFGSSLSRAGAGKPGRQPASLFANLRGRAQNPTPSHALGGRFGVPASSPPAGRSAWVPGDDEDYETEEEDVDLEDDLEATNDDETGYARRDTEDEDMEQESVASDIPSPPRRSFNSSGSLDDLGLSRGTKRSRLGESVGPKLSSQVAEVKGKIYDFAKVLTPFDPPASLKEPDEFLLEAEKALGKIATNHLGAVEAESTMNMAQELTDLLRQHGQRANPHLVREQVGPAEAESPLVKANFLGSLALKLHHTPQLDPRSYPGSSRFGRSRAVAHSDTTRRDTPLPKVLLDWLNEYHDPTAHECDELFREKRGYSAASNFWDVVIFTTLRGRFNQVIKLLRGANFSAADSAISDGNEQAGYTGKQLRNVNLVVQQVVQLLESCPAVQSNDWDMSGGDWSLFRRRIAANLSELREFAEGESKDRGDDDDDFGLSTASSKSLGVSRASRRAECTVPWSVYECLQDLHHLMLGVPAEIMKNATDWVEAVVGLAIWWDCGEEEIQRGNLAMSRRSLTRSQRNRPIDSGLTDQQRMELAFTFVIGSPNEEGLGIVADSRVEIGLACIFLDDVEGLIGVLKGWSIATASAMVEIASAGGWLPDARPQSKNMMKGFDEGDLMVLSYGQEGETAKKSQKDEIMTQYAGLLANKETLKSADNRTVEGWELALQVLGRLDSVDTSNERIGELLDHLPLESTSRADKLINICNSMGFADHAMIVAERYADSVAESTSKYGTAILYYARAHNAKKLKDVLDLLISCCLVHSVSYPPASALDTTLRSFIDAPKQTLTQLARSDTEAAQYLSSYLSGYATLRKFYDVRDQALSQGDAKPREIARKRDAAAALVAVVDSAADSIRGGLYDPDVDVVVQVDGLLTLLGEALVFLDQSTRILTLPQLFTLLKAIEDLQTSPSLIREACESHFRSALSAHHSPSSSLTPSATLKKSMSNLTKSTSNLSKSTFSLVGSSMLGASTVGSSESSGVLVPGDVKRGWDWRSGFATGASGEEVLRIARLGIAREVGRAWANGEMA